MLVFGVLAVGACRLSAQETQPEPPHIDVHCISDDENFTRFYDFLAVVAAFMGFLLVPSIAPLIPGVRNSWTLAGPAARWLASFLVVSALLLTPFFLLPQLARVSPSFRPFGLVPLHFLGNIRLEYVDCNLESVPRDYGFFFFLHWNPGPNLMISYWWSQLFVYGVYGAICSAIYFALVAIISQRRMVVLGR
jgi:hypothetical protein